MKLISNCLAALMLSVLLSTDLIFADNVNQASDRHALVTVDRSNPAACKPFYAGTAMARIAARTKTESDQRNIVV